MLEILYRIHKEPKSWLSSMGVFSLEKAAAVANGCEVLAESGLSLSEIKRAIQESPKVLDALVDGNYELATIHAKQIVSVPRRDALDPATGEWIQLPDPDPPPGPPLEDLNSPGTLGPAGVAHYFEQAEDGTLRHFGAHRKK